VCASLAPKKPCGLSCSRRVSSRHALVLDGVFARDVAGVVAFHAAPRLTTL